MITPEQLRLAMTQKDQKGYKAFTKGQIADRVIAEDSFMGQKIRRASELGVSRQQALNFFSFGTSNGQEPEPKKGGFFSQIADDIKQRSANVGMSLERQAAGEQGMGSTALQTAGEAFGLAFGDVPGQTISSGLEATPDAVKDPFKQMGIAFLQTDLGKAGLQAISQGMESYDAWKAQNTVAAENLESLVNIGAALPVGAMATKGMQVAKSGAKTALKTTKSVVQSVPPFRPKGVDELLPEVDDVVGKIVQGDKSSIEQGRKALRLLDTEGIETYEDLGSAIKNKIGAISRKQDELLETVPERKALDSFTRVAKAGSRQADTNPVRSTLDHLEELYKTTDQPEELVRIQNLKDIAAKEGLSAKQVNDLAREYGTEFGKKAFGKTGEPLTSVNAQLHENTRKGIKNAARGLLPDDSSKLLDEGMSSLYDTQKLIDKMADQAQKLTNKIEKRNIFQKVAAAVGGGIDKALGRTPSSLITSLLIRGNVGMKQLNSLQLQDNLAKNLGKLNKLMDKLDDLSDNEAVQRIVNILSDQ